jgi:hypothetical protein
MGRVEARYADWRIGTVANRSQLWIDRNFALDYTLKSLEKLLDGDLYRRVHDVREILKNAAHLLLGGMILALNTTDILTADHHGFDAECAAIAEAMITELRGQLEPAITALVDDLPPRQRNLLKREFGTWAATTGWKLINTAESCGT